MQQIWDFMQTMQTSFNDLRIHMDNRMNSFERRMDEVEIKAAATHYYARDGVMHNNLDYEDQPPTPPYQRRAAQRREEALAREREAAAAAQAEQQAEAAAQEGAKDGEDGEDMEDDED